MRGAVPSKHHLPRPPTRGDFEMTEQLRETRAAGLDLRPLRENLDGDAIGPDDPSWDEARRAWNLAVDQRPAAVVLPESVVDVVATVAFAHEHGLRIAPQGTGHGAARARRPLRHDPAQDHPDARRRDRSRRPGSPASKPARSGSTSSRRPPSMASLLSPAPRRTSASSAIRSAAGSRGSRASTGSARTRSPRSRA